MLTLILRLVVGEEQVELHSATEAHSSVILLDERRVEATCFTDLLLDVVAPVASDLEIVLHSRVNRDYSLTDRHLGETCGSVDL